jgi:hypothetical protein
MVVVTALGLPGLKVTEPSAFTIGVAIERVFVSALVDANVHVDIPDAFVTEHAPYVFAAPVSVAPNVGVWPDTGLLLASLRVTVTVEVATPSAVTGVVPVIVEFTATAAPAVKTTVPSALMTGVAMERVLVSALLEAKVQVATPEAFVIEQVP